MILLLARDGAECIAGGALEALATLDKFALALPADLPGHRLAQCGPLAGLLASDGLIGRHVAIHLGPAARPVRAVLFNKSIGNNWGLGWHQDRTIVVAAPEQTPGFGPWTLKAGLHHVAPPIDLLERMITIRVHLDPVPATNAPLLVSPATHRLGRIEEKCITETVARHGIVACLADCGDIWLYSTPVLHASEAAVSPTRRRVLQVDYAAEDLPGGLQWLRVG